MCCEPQLQKKMKRPTSDEEIPTSSLTSFQDSCNEIFGLDHTSSPLSSRQTEPPLALPVRLSSTPREKTRTAYVGRGGYGVNQERWVLSTKRRGIN